MIERRERRRSDGSVRVVWRVRWYEGERERSRSFDRRADARAFEGKVRTLKRSDALADLDAGRETLAEFAEQWWQLYAVPNLERRTLQNYAHFWNRHALPRLGAVRLRDLTPQAIVGFRAELQREGVGQETIRRTMTMVQGMLQRAVEWQRISSNPVRATRKPPATRRRAVVPLPPAKVEELRARLLAEGRLRDATLVSVLAYAGLRPQEALALQWHHVREHTLTVEQALSDGELKGQKTNKPPRWVDLLAPLRQDLAEWRLASGRPPAGAFLFPAADGRPWRDHDWRNWRKRVYGPAAEACGFPDPRRPYALRHSFASLLTHAGQHSIVDIAQQLGHNPNVCLSTYAHVIAELRGAERIGAEEQIRAAREAGKGSAFALRDNPECGPNAAQREEEALSASPNPAPQMEAQCRTRTDDPFLTMEVLYQLS